MGGNWFFLVGDHPMELTLKNVNKLTDFTWAIRQALHGSGIAGADGKEIDHIELFGPSELPGVDSRNFVLCPGKAYDRLLVALGRVPSWLVFMPTARCGRVRPGSKRVLSEVCLKAA